MTSGHDWEQLLWTYQVRESKQGKRGGGSKFGRKNSFLKIHKAWQLEIGLASWSCWWGDSNSALLMPARTKVGGKEGYQSRMSWTKSRVRRSKLRIQFPRLKMIEKTLGQFRDTPESTTEPWVWTTDRGNSLVYLVVGTTRSYYLFPHYWPASRRNKKKKNNNNNKMAINKSEEKKKKNPAMGQKI